MGLKVALEGAAACGKSVWLAQLQPHELKLLGSPKHADGERSVLMVSEPTFEASGSRLEFDASRVVVLNLGTTTEAILVDAGRQGAEGNLALVAPPHAPVGIDRPRPAFGRGDRTFLELVRREAPDLEATAEGLLLRVRGRFPGDLEKGERRNFTEASDNFWGVLLQPQAGNLMISIRGEPKNFTGSRLELRPYRSRYTRFYIKNVDEVDAAFDLIVRAPKKGLFR